MVGLCGGAVLAFLAKNGLNHIGLLGTFWGKLNSYRVYIGYARASQGITSITVELAGWLEQKTALEKVEIVKYGAKCVFEPPKQGFSNEGRFGAHRGPVRALHRSSIHTMHGHFIITLCILLDPTASRYPRFSSK